MQSSHGGEPSPDRRNPDHDTGSQPGDLPRNPGHDAASPDPWSLFITPVGHHRPKLRHRSRTSRQPRSGLSRRRVVAAAITAVLFVSVTTAAVVIRPWSHRPPAPTGSHIAHSRAAEPISRPTSRLLPVPVQYASSAAPVSTLDGIACPTAKQCWAVGNSGIVLATSDGGKTWLPQSSGTEDYLSAISCPTTQRCWAVGYKGTVLATRNGGRSWENEASGTEHLLYDIACPTDVDCWAVGSAGVIDATTDGGARWHLEPSGTSATLGGISCTTTSSCVAVGNLPYELWTFDGGSAWMKHPSNAPGYLAKVDCVAGWACTAVGAGGFGFGLETSGKVWLDQALGTSQPLYDVSCPMEGRCIAVGGSGTILTGDAGSSTTEISSTGTSTWQLRNSVATGRLDAIACPTASLCLVVGAGDVILASTDGGRSWRLDSYPTPSGPPVRTLLVGGSVALTLGIGMSIVQSEYAISLDDQGILGCGISQGEPIRVHGKPIVLVATPCDGRPGVEQWPQIWAGLVAKDNPQVAVVLIGRWETVDRWHDGRWMHIGQPAYDAYLRRQLKLAVEVLGAGGAKVVFLTSPYFDSQPPPPGGGHWPEDQPGRVQKLNSLIDEEAASDPSVVRVIDFGQKISPGGKFARSVDGVQVRLGDGIHMTVEGGEWVASWLLPQLHAIGQAVSPATHAVAHGTHTMAS